MCILQTFVKNILAILAILDIYKLKMIKIISTNNSIISAKLKNEIPINKPKLPPIFDIKSNTVICAI